MSSYSTPAPLSLTKLAAMVRGGSVAPVLDMIWVPLLSALLIVAVGSIGFWMKQPWLFAALGPTILMVANNPGHETTRLRAVVGGHLAAIACAYLALLILNANEAPALLATVKGQDLSPRVWASAAALAMLAMVQPQLKAYHPPAAATALLVTLGAFKMTGRTPLALMGGVVVVAVLAEVLQRLRPRAR
jgi:hypothetical protein